MAKELLEGNEAFAEAAVRAGLEAFFGYPITPQSEALEHLSKRLPELDRVFLQAESEVAAINMLYGGAGCGKRVMTSSSSPGISLMQEGLSYMAGAELPCVVANIVRGGPGLGTIQPSQSDYFQSVKGGGHGDYRMIVMAPASVQEMADFVEIAFELAFKYRNPAMILSDGMIGQMMEKVELKPQQERLSEEEITQRYNWATTGKTPDRERNIITSVELDAEAHEHFNDKLQAKYQEMQEKEVRYEVTQTEDAEYLIVAYGSSARISSAAVEILRERGIKAGMLRPITLFPFPVKPLAQLANQVKGILSVEMSSGQMIEDVRLAVNGKVKAEHFGRYGGVVPSPEEVADALEQKLTGGK